jgi:hypothetical protein
MTSVLVVTVSPSGRQAQMSVRPGSASVRSPKKPATSASVRAGTRWNVRRIITGTLDECVRRGVIPRHTVSGIELAPRIVTAEQYEQAKGMVPVSDDTVRMLAEGITAAGTDKNGRARTRIMPRPGYRALAPAHHGTADQGSPGRSQG